jgi:hypothetical protein
MGEAAERDELDLRTQLLEEFSFYAPLALRVRTKAGRIVPFEFNEAQQYLDYRAEEQRKRTGKVRLLVLKSRQQGASTYITGRGYFRTSQNKGLRAFVIAHLEDATANLFEMVRRYHQHAPPWLRPKTKASNRQELDFAMLDSGYRLATAKNPEAGRSDTVQFFHGSEVAFWRHANKILEGALQALADEEDTEGWLESTANGRAGRFWELCDVAQKAERGEMDPATGQPYASEWELAFVPWFWSKEYRSQVPLGFQRTKKEELLCRFIRNTWDTDLTDEQLQWRRKKIGEFGGGEEGELSFRQEYPAPAEEAFLLSGRKFFSVAKVERMLLAATAPKERGYLEQHGEEVRFVPDEEGWLEVWSRPVKGFSYVVGCDVSEGTITGDQHSGHVLARGEIPRQVARFAPHCDADEFGRRSVLVAKWYRNAWLGIERNNTMGGACVTAAIATQYDRIYRGEILDNDTGKVAKKFGWLTTSASRPLMLQKLQATIRDSAILVQSSVTAGQCETFVLNEDGKPEAADGARDDEVLGLAIAVQMTERTEADDPGLDLSGKKGADGPPQKGRYGMDCA